MASHPAEENLMLNRLIIFAVALLFLPPIALTLALAGTLVEKRRVALTAGTLGTDSVAFGIWFAFVILMLGALNFVPALTLGPVVEHMNLLVSQ